jgi:hypothetical protein
MGFPKPTLDQDAAARIIPLLINYRSRFATMRETLADGVSVIYTAKLLESGAVDLYLGQIRNELVEAKARFVALDDEFTALYAGYAASTYKTGVTNFIAACDTLNTWISTNADTYYKSATEGKYMVMEMPTAHKNALATQITTALG